MKLPLTSFVRYKYLVESIQDEIWSLVEAMMDSPVSIPHYKKSMSASKAIRYIYVWVCLKRKKFNLLLIHYLIIWNLYLDPLCLP
jgi:hypothetical protein